MSDDENHLFDIEEVLWAEPGRVARLVTSYLEVCVLQVRHSHLSAVDVSDGVKQVVSFIYNHYRVAVKLDTASLPGWQRIRCGQPKVRKIFPNEKLLSTSKIRLPRKRSLQDGSNDTPQPIWIEPCQNL